VARVGVFGWGIVAPHSPNIDAFASNLQSTDSWLDPFNGFGPDNFLVGTPQFDFDDYRDWIVERFAPSRFHQLREKMDPTVLYAIGAYVQSTRQNPGIQEELTRLGTQTHVYLGTGLGSIPTHHDISIEFYHSQRAWNRFWTNPERNTALEEFHKHGTADADVPPDPAGVPAEQQVRAEDAWWSYWAERSDKLQEFLAEVRDIENITADGEVESAKLAVIREKRRRTMRLLEKWKCPEPPWTTISANMLWNIANTGASQVSMLGQITGMTFAPVAACSTFGLTLKLAKDAIDRGEAKAVVVGASDPPPHPLVVGAFYSVRVLSANAAVSKPLTKLQGTHVAGGSVVWLVCDMDHMLSRGFRPLGMEPVAIGVSSDADHIITPSREGPTTCMRMTFEQAHASPSDVGSWDMHATATPGDFLEIETLAEQVPESVLVTARKGTFGHGMSAGGGWELTAQYLGYERGTLYPTPLSRDELNGRIASMRDHFVYDRGCTAPAGLAGKLSMGIGGINACVLSRPLEKSP
jgi:3-oxoacyl-(acyl-carrier-protein) synthase